MASDYQIHTSDNTTLHRSTVIDYEAIGEANDADQQSTVAELTQRFYRHIVRNYGVGTYDAGVKAAHYTDGYEAANCRRGHNNSRDYLSGGYSTEMTGSVIQTISDWVETVRQWKLGRGHGPADNYDAKCNYGTVMKGMQSLKEWQIFKRHKLLATALQNIRPSNSALSLCASVRLVDNFDDTGIVQDYNNVSNGCPARTLTGSYSKTDNKYLCLALQSDWLSRWPLTIKEHKALPQGVMFVGASYATAMHGRYVSVVKYVKSMQGSRYTCGDGYVCKWNNKFLLAKTRRALENLYMRTITECLIEKRHSDVVSASKADHGGTLDSLTRKSLEAAVMPDALRHFKDHGTSSSEEIS